ncbi:MAG: acyl-CoA dehydrogenase family protein [Desulfobacterales bacterium]|nr:acyl-CoA dehydrogenase family protein [Desulfobacterales bacterium]
MKFKLDKSQIQIQRAARDFVKGEFTAERCGEYIESHTFPKTLLAKAAELGFIGGHFPEAYGGQELGWFDMVLIGETLCMGDASLGAGLMRTIHGAGLLLEYGSEEQKAHWLPRMTDGEILCCEAVDGVLALEDGDHWLITGHSDLVVNAGQLAGCALVLCRNEAGDGASVILVEIDRKGVECRNPGKVLGAQISDMAHMVFNQVRVPLGHVVGRRGRGLKQYETCQADTWLMESALVLGMAQGAHDRAAVHAKKRVQFGNPLIAFQAIRHKLSDMAAQIQAARLMVYQAAWLRDQGKRDGKLSAMAKLNADQAAAFACDEAIQILGGYGYIDEFEVERYFREARFSQTLFGNSTVLKDTITRA